MVFDPERKGVGGDHPHDNANPSAGKPLTEEFADGRDTQAHRRRSRQASGGTRRSSSRAARNSSTARPGAADTEHAADDGDNAES